MAENKAHREVRTGKRVREINGDGRKRNRTEMTVQVWNSATLEMGGVWMLAVCEVAELVISDWVSKLTGAK